MQHVAQMQNSNERITYIEEMGHVGEGREDKRHSVEENQRIITHD